MLRTGGSAGSALACTFSVYSYNVESFNLNNHTGAESFYSCPTVYLQGRKYRKQMYMKVQCCCNYCFKTDNLLYSKQSSSNICGFTLKK